MRIFVKIICLAGLLLAATIPARAQFGPSLVFDARTGEVLVADRAGVPWHPASLTKLMTAYVTFRALREGKIRLDQRLVVSEYAAKRPPSKIGMKAGSTVTVDFALKAILIHSANDMAVVLAEGVAGSVPAFAARMNRQARRIGMTGSHFVNPNGLHNDAQVTTARDLGLLASTILAEFPQYQHYFAATHMQVGKRRLRNRNKLVRTLQWVDGMKTGYLCTSGYNLVTSATVNGRRLVSVSLGARSAFGRNELSRVLLEWGGAAASRSSLRVAKIRNRGGKAPNLRPVVCKRPERVTWGRIDELNGWGISFGQYKSAYTADAVLHGRLLVASKLVHSGKIGVFRSPQSRQFIAVLSQIGQSESLTLCNFLRRRNAHCEVLTPETFSTLKAQKIEAAKALKQRRKYKRRKFRKPRVKTSR